jgi:Spy/CpxP family protein refolding chaperone
MHLTKLAVAAALTLSSLAVPAVSADAQNRGHHNGWQNNRGHHNGWRNNRRQRVCRWVWRHHHRQRVCSWRYRR